MKYELCPLEELVPGKPTRFVVGGIAMVVVRTPEDTVFALRDICSHEGARLSNGRLFGKVVGDDVGVYKLSEAEYVIRCPWHGYEFDVTTGLCLADPSRARVRAYQVVVEDQNVFIHR